MNMNVLAPPDTNANGLPDNWEAGYAISDPGADADGDGQSNLQEYQANTNPTNAGSVLKSFVFPDYERLCGVFLGAVGGTRYRVQFANGDVAGGVSGPFTDIVRPLTNEMDLSQWGAASTQSFTDDFTLTGGPPERGGRYYRIKITP